MLDEFSLRDTFDLCQSVRKFDEFAGETQAYLSEYAA